jgi:hypothetical protein
MAEAAYTARATTKAHVIAEVTKLNLPLTNGQYSHDAATTFVLGLHRVLKSTYNPSSGLGMSELLRSSTDPTNPSAIAGIRTTDSATIASVIDASIKEARKLQAKSATPDVPIPPAIEGRADAIDAADRENILNQSVIGAKEGVTDAINEKVGTRVTDSVLRTADGTDYKSIDEYELHSLVAAVLQAAERPRIRDVRRNLSAAIAMHFNFRQRVADNVSVLRARMARLATYGITVPESMIATIILAEVDDAAREPWGREIETAVAKIRRTYPYNHAHNAASVAAILKELAAADAVRNMMEAPAPDEPTNRAAAVDDVMSHVQRLVFDSDTETGTAASATTGYRSESSEENARPARSRSRRKKGDRDRGRSKAREKTERPTAANNPCKHCRKWRRRARHPKASEDQCFWNKSWKGFRPRYCCEEMDVPFKARDRFSERMGGYASDSGASSGEE